MRVPRYRCRQRRASRRSEQHRVRAEELCARKSLCREVAARSTPRTLLVAVSTEGADDVPRMDAVAHWGAGKTAARRVQGRRAPQVRPLRRKPAQCTARGHTSKSASALLRGADSFSTPFCALLQSSAEKSNISRSPCAPAGAAAPRRQSSQPPPPPDKTHDTFSIYSFSSAHRRASRKEIPWCRPGCAVWPLDETLTRRVGQRLKGPASPQSGGLDTDINSGQRRVTHGRHRWGDTLASPFVSLFPAALCCRHPAPDPQGLAPAYGSRTACSTIDAVREAHDEPESTICFVRRCLRHWEVRTIGNKIWGEPWRQARNEDALERLVDRGAGRIHASWTDAGSLAPLVQGSPRAAEG